MERPLASVWPRAGQPLDELSDVGIIRISTTGAQVGSTAVRAEPFQ
jgi:hypothetical protein